MRPGLIALAALAAGSPVNAFGGSTAPERVTQRYDLECGGRTGSFAIEQRFDRAVPSYSVAIKDYTALGGSAPGPAGTELAEAAAKMARIDRVNWLCDGQTAKVSIEYLDRPTYDQAVKTDQRITDQPSRMRRTVLALDADGLKVETAGTPIEAGSPRR